MTHTLEERRRYAARHPETLRAARRRWKSANADKNRAHMAVHRAIRRGILARADTCEACGRPAATEAHHFKGYAPEHVLSVQWLCHACHVAATPTLLNDKWA